MKWCLNFDPWLAVNSTPRQKATTSLCEITAVKRIMTSAVLVWIPIASPSSKAWIDSAVKSPMMPAIVCWQGSWWLVWQILALMLSSSTSCLFWCSSHVDVSGLSDSSVCWCVWPSVDVVPYDEWPWWLCDGRMGWYSSGLWTCWCWIASPQKKWRSSSAK